MSSRPVEGSLTTVIVVLMRISRGLEKARDEIVIEERKTMAVLCCVSL